MYDLFYEREESNAPTEGTILLGLQDKLALLLLDDIDLTVDEMVELRDAVPNCFLLVTAPERKLRPGDGQVVRLSGLPPDAALALVERSLGRQLSATEKPITEELCSTLKCNPLRIVQEVARAEDEGLQLADLLALPKAMAQAHGPENDCRLHQLAVAEAGRRPISRRMPAMSLSLRAISAFISATRSRYFW